MPHTLRKVDVGDDVAAELTVLVGFDDDLAAEATGPTNRIRSLLTQIHPAAERVLGPHVQQPAALALLAKYGGHAGLRTAGAKRLTATATKADPRSGPALAA